MKKPAAGFPARALNSCDDETMPVICPTCQNVSEAAFLVSNPMLATPAWQMRQTTADMAPTGRTNPRLMKSPTPPDGRLSKSPQPVFPARALNSCDDETMQVICPTCQMFLKRLFWYRTAYSQRRAGRPVKQLRISAPTGRANPRLMTSTAPPDGRLSKAGRRFSRAGPKILPMMRVCR